MLPDEETQLEMRKVIENSDALKNWVRPDRPFVAQKLLSDLMEVLRKGQNA